MVAPIDNQEAYRMFVTHAETIGLIISGVSVTGILALMAFARKILALPKEMMVVKAALFRLLRSNKKQGTALIIIAECQKSGKCNGDTDIAVKAVKKDQESIDTFLTNAALGKVDLKEDDE